MKIFDYKFLILLGLSLVVYFIYREVEYLRGKVDKLEKELKGKSPELVDFTQPKAITNKPLLALPKPPGTETAQEIPKPEIVLNVIQSDPGSGKSSPKIISVDMSPSKATEPSGFESGVKLTKMANKQKTQTDSESNSESSSSKHLAIYSNDNEQYDETQNSLLESIESNKLELNFDYAEKPIPKIETNVNEIINMVTSENSAQKISNTHTESEVENSDGISIGGISISSNKKSSSSESESGLEKKKLPELKKIAESKNISLTKKVNGQQKPKNKQELIKDILNSNK